ncbi:D(1A) dopamine receptor-like [Diadema antillarum]|uniref:D(1A) dopamine receptor-like n=1 Tax=Diadema antillarum TaxID=105358 RepID=UPI003A8428A9
MTNYFLISMGLAHILFQLICVAVCAVARKACDFTREQIIGFSVVILTAFSSVFYHTTLVTLETYWKICFPFWYSRVITEKKCLGLIGLVWTGSIVFGVTAGRYVTFKRTHPCNTNTNCALDDIFDQNSDFITMILDSSFAPSIILTTALKLRIIFTARQQAKRVAPMGGKEAIALNDQQRTFKNVRKSTINLVLFVVTYLCAWIPIFITANVGLVCSSCNVSRDVFIMSFVTVVNITSYGPVIFTMRQPEFARLKRLYLQRLKAVLPWTVENGRRIEVKGISQTESGTTDRTVTVTLRDSQ